MGQRVVQFYHAEAKRLNDAMGTALPDTEIAFLPADSETGMAYIRDMNHALAYAFENRRMMMEYVKEIMAGFSPASSLSRRSTSITITPPWKHTAENRTGFTARVPPAQKPGSWGLSPAAWEIRRTSSRVWAIPNRSCPAPTARAGG
jgi:hypothetical protein